MPVSPSCPKAPDSALLGKAVERLGSDGRFDGVLLFGSLARGEARPDSDLDLIAVHRGSVPDDVLDELPSGVSVAFYTAERLTGLPDRNPLFANHLAREGIVLHDRSGILSETLRRVEPIGATAAHRLAELTERRFWDVLSDPSFTPSDQLSAAELYALCRQTAFLDSARSGAYEFNRHRAFRLLGDKNPHLRSDVENVKKLEPVWLARRRAHVAHESIPLSIGLTRSVARVLQVLSSR